MRRNKFLYLKFCTFLFFIISMGFFTLSFVSAAPISDSLHLNIQTTDIYGNIVTGTFDFIFKISTDSGCSNVLYSDSSTLTTDNRGIISHYLNSTSMDYGEQYYLCYYRDGDLIDVSPIARTPYSFRSKYVNVSGIEVDSNLDLSGYNLTANYLFGSGKYLTDLNVSELNMSNYYTTLEINSFNFWNDTYATFNKTYADTLYYGIGNPYGYYNSTTLNLSSVNYWTKDGTDLYYNDGNVGIGTSSPGAKLEIKGDTATDSNPPVVNLALRAIYGTSTSRQGIGFYVNNEDYLNAGIFSPPNALSFFTSSDWDAEDATEKMRITGSGNVGIGTTSPSAKLSVNGNATIGGILYMGNNKISNLANGTTATDAVTYSQLQAISSTVSGDYVPYTGATGNVNLGSHNLITTGNVIGNIAASNITSGILSVNRGGTGIASYTTGNYIYASGATTLAQRTPAQVRADINAVNKSGDTMTGNLVMGTNKITGLGNGTSAQDAVTKSQLDAVNSALSGNVSDTYVPYTGAIQNVNLNGKNLTNVGYLGNSSSRITGVFMIDADVSNNLSVGENLSVGGDLEIEGDASVSGDVNVEGYVYSDVCPEGMTYINKLGGYCIDKYEASRPDATGSSMGSDTSKAVSQQGVIPWVSISQINARTACENAGKHLCTDEEWLGAANVQGQMYYLPTNLAVAPYYCVTDSSTYCLDNSYSSGEACDTGTYSGGASGCYSAEGVYDMVGNVWEWTNETIDVTNPDGTAGWKYANQDGEWQSSTSGLWNKYGNDGVYFPTTTTARAVGRGGDWYYGANAGPFCAYLYYAPTITSYGIGFRCCA